MSIATTKNSKGETITLGGNMKPPCVCHETAQEVYSIIKNNNFDIGQFNGVLMAIVTYLDVHDIKYGDKALPWAEIVKTD